MKDYKGNDNIYDLAHEELAVFEQHQYQFENCSVTLFLVKEDGEDLKEGDLLVRENYIAESGYFIVDADEKASALADPKQFVCDVAASWAANGEDDERLERLRWGFDSLEDVEACEDLDGECAVIVSYNMYGYTPVEYVEETFDSYVAAQEWIDEEEEGTYYLSHNEAGRPTYTIVEA